MRILTRNKLAFTAAIVLLLIIGAAVFSPLIATHDPQLITLEPDKICRPPSAEHYFGTDDLGRDIWSSIVYGSRTSLVVAFVAMFTAVLLGTACGAVAGYFGGIIDVILMRLVDIFLSLPTVFFLIIIAAIFKPGSLGIAILLGLTGWMGIARMVRGQVLSLKEREFVEAARALGYSDRRIIFAHLLPNLAGQIIVHANLTVAGAILTESAVSFLGLGVQPPQFSWGTMLYAAQDFVLLKNAPWTAIFPGLAIFVTVLCLNYIGGALRDAWDPKVKNSGESAGLVKQRWNNAGNFA